MPSAKTGTAWPQLDQKLGGALLIFSGGFTSLVFGAATLWLLREQLHIGCDAYADGPEAAYSWICSDGIGYLAPGLTLVTMTALVVVVGLVVTALVRSDRSARVWFTVLAALPIVWTLAWTWYGSERLVYPPPGVHPIEYWIGSLGPAALVCLLALVVAVMALFVSGRMAFGLTVAAVVSIGIATVLQPGIGIASGATAALLCAALLRTKKVTVAGRLARTTVVKLDTSEVRARRARRTP
ncbi:hypothetical protein [Microbacterium sp. JZ31]|uniref:hypothetical protein n=1 Tax=Microbacterium sp. JZ31 TaxID=1906274 RepID=UPI0019333545|nr:hypothetical protein [Microbacterium sp. JZ31]